MIRSLNNFRNEFEESKLLLNHINKIGHSPKYLKIRAATSKSLIVVLCGLFEQFLKEALMEFIEEVNTLNIPKKYANVMWTNNKKNTLELLKLILDKKIDADYEEIVLKHATSFAKETKKNNHALIKEAFSITKYNPNKSTIKDMFKRIGIKNIFSEEIFSCKFKNVGLVKAQLDSFIELRHSFAHGDKGIIIPSLGGVNDYFDFINNLVYVLNNALENEKNRILGNFNKDCFSYLDKIINTP